MAIFTIFLCTVIGYAFGYQQLTEIGEDYSKAKEDAKKVYFPVNLEQSLKSKENAQSSVSFAMPGKDFTIKTIRTFREQRDQSDACKEIREPALRKKHRKPHRNILSDKPPKRTKLKKTKKKKYKDRQKSKKQETESVTIPETRVSAVSYSAMLSLLNKLPDVLKSRILITDDKEKVVLENYVKYQNVKPKTLDIYNSAKKDERELLKRLLTDIPFILPTYKSIRKGVAWNH